MTRDVLDRLLQELSLEKSARDIILDSIQDWRDSNEEHRLNGAESDYYQTLPVPYRSKNANFDTGVEDIAHPADGTGELRPRDGGFGTAPHPLGGFGDGRFNTPSLVEAADTPPFFHHNAFATIEDAVAFYDTEEFNASPAGAIVEGIDLTEAGIRQIGKFLRSINALENIRSAIEQAVSTGSVLSEAESSREIARLLQALGRNQEALQLLGAAHRLFGRLDARVDLVDVAGKVAQLEETYAAVVREWGQSIESSDSYTFGHCERVAGYGVAVARAMGLDATGQTTVRMGAYLHDLGKVRVPHEILNKPGPLTPEEFEVIKQHPVWGLELLATVHFPWDIKPIIHWHHERSDGMGYPDRLRGEEIPLGAQIICIVDVYDALTTTRSYRGALSPAEAQQRMDECRQWWRPDVYRAFREVIPA